MAKNPTYKELEKKYALAMKELGEMRRSESRFRTLFEQSNDSIALIDPITDEYRDVNKRTCELLGYSREELLSMAVSDIMAPEFRKKKGTALKYELQKYEGRPFETVDLRKDGTRVPVEVCASLMKGTDENLVLNIVRDITDRKKAEEKLIQLINEKNMLMKEMNHRIKNNLLIVSSLISLKSDSLDGGPDLSDLSHQVDAISIIHEMLYHTEQIEQVNANEYFRKLFQSVFNSFLKNQVTIVSEIEDISIDTKRTVSIGLIINEIATNALKYGFPNIEKPEFTATLKKEESHNRYILTLSNNGAPFPEDIALDNPETLGLRLITALVEQIEGTIELQRTPHPRFTITFPVFR